MSTVATGADGRERERRTLYARLFGQVGINEIELDLISFCQSQRGDAAELGAWRMLGYILQSAKEPAPDEEAA